jgi:lipoprotein-anchoring transpeptidase ErfK/SrfK
MKLKSVSVVALAAMTMGLSAANASGNPFRHFINNFRDCLFDNNNPYERTMTDYERLTTAPPPNANYPMTPFKESDFQTKPWLRQFEYVIVVNISNSVVQNENLPSNLPLNMAPYSSYGITDKQSTDAIRSFNAQFSPLAQQVFGFGKISFDRNNKPVPSNIPGAQTVRIYRNGQLIRVARISTGRNQFEIRGQNPACKTRPAESYYSITEPGYFTFQELQKSGYESASYDDADMPNAMFYMRNRGIALHEEPEDNLIANLGRRASGGCTRMDPDTAANLFDAIYATRGAQIPVIDRSGSPVRDANGQLTYKTKEVVTYSEGGSRQRQAVGPAYSALLINQRVPVEVQNPAQDAYVSFKFNRSVFNSQGQSRF